MRPFLPLLDSRECLIVLEILTFGIKQPNIIIYTSSLRECNGSLFRKEILFQWSSYLFLDICIALNVSKNKRQDILSLIGTFMLEGRYNRKQLTLGVPFLDASIMACTDLILETYSDKEYIHWRFYFAKVLLSFSWESSLP
jgi:hypothetical protein